jgi:hypothetical protein
VTVAMVDKRQVCASSSAGFSGLVPKACRFALMLSIPRCLVVQRSVRMQCSGIQPASMPSACGTQWVGCKGVKRASMLASRSTENASQLGVYSAPESNCGGDCAACSF